MIEFDDTVFAYGDRAILKGARVTLESGSLHFLTGRSGAGKTTMLKLAWLALTPQAGAVRLFGADFRGASSRERARLRRRIGVVSQEADLLPHLSVFDNVALPLRARGEDVSTRIRDVEELARWVRIDDRLDALPAELSTGERRRAIVARAVIGGPEIVFADEPTGDVDEEAAERVLRLLLELNEIGKTVLIATHDLSLIRKAQGRSQARTLRIENGVVLRAGSSL